MTNYSKSPSFKSQSPFSLIQRVAPLLVAFGQNEDIFVSGSCVRIAKNLYLTARHVMTDYLQRFGYEGNEAKFSVWAVHIQPGPEYSIWQMDRLWLSPHSDLALFHTTPYNDTAGAEKTTASVGLDLTPPFVGSRVVGYGYHSSSGRITVDADGKKQIAVNSDGSASVGEVREIHRLSRDSAMLTFPCFRVNARFDGGMSGGPLFGDNGRLCGVICSSLPAGSGDQEDCSYAATLWPLMGLAIDANPSPYGILNSSYPLLELARRQIIHVSDLARVSVRTTSAPHLYEVTLNEHPAI